MSLMSDDPLFPWRLVELKILVANSLLGWVSNCVRALTRTPLICRQTIAAASKPSSLPTSTCAVSSLCG